MIAVLRDLTVLAPTHLYGVRSLPLAATIIGRQSADSAFPESYS